MNSMKALLIYKTNLIDVCLAWSVWANFWYPYSNFTLQKNHRGILLHRALVRLKECRTRIRSELENN